jgi:hypothetical protein
VTKNGPEFIEVIQVRPSFAFLPPAPRPERRQFRLRKRGLEADLVRIA